MRVLLSTIGSRGDVQPLVALALELRALGTDVHLCVPPDFRDWIEGLGFTVTPIGPELKSLTAGGSGPIPSRLTPEQLKQMAEASVVTQFETVAAAARGCNAIVAATAIQIAARSVAETLGIPYAFTAYCPTVLPSTLHAPTPLRARGQEPAPETADFPALWEADRLRFTQTFGAALNAQRARLGLTDVDDVRTHVFGDRPWLASDPVLAPWPVPDDAAVFQPGAWLVPDDAPLAPELEAFLDAGEPPVYFGFGSMAAPRALGDAMLASARRVGRRAIVSRGWAELVPDDGAADCLVIDEVNQRALFPRCAAVVHHGGAGTTTVAARAGAPQVVAPQMYDQHYFAGRVDALGIGVAHAGGVPSADSLTVALDRALTADVATRARAIATEIRSDGAGVAAARLTRVLLSS